MKRLLSLTIAFSLALPTFSQSMPDVIYYNEGWGICEKPLASCYRVGKMVIDSFWYFKGPVRDYYMDGRLRMEGTYDELGLKNGLFKSFYENGNPKSIGNYSNNSMNGNWKFFYPNGKDKAEILFQDLDFVFINFWDSTGNKLLEGSSGKFTWPVNENRFDYTYILKGEFLNGKRHGAWNFFGNFFGLKEAQFKEVYEKGNFKKGISHSVSHDVRYKEPMNINLTPYELVGAEQFEADTYFEAHRNAENFYNYLFHQKPLLYTDTSSGFEGSLVFMINKLSDFRSRFDYDEKKYNGRISFLLDEEGLPKNINVEGNVTENEKQILSFLTGKFRNLKMPGVNKVGIEKYHTIYFFSFDSKDYIKDADINFKDLIFSHLPPEQAIKKVRFVKE